MAVVLLIGQKSLWWVGIRSHYLQGCVYPKCRSPTDWVCCFRCRLLTRGNLQNIKHGLLVRHHDTRKWMHKPECCFFGGGGHMIFFHQNSQGVFLVNSSCVTTLHCDGKINPVQWYTNGLHSREWVSISHETFAQLFTFEGDMLVPRRVRLPIFQERSNPFKPSGPSLKNLSSDISTWKIHQQNRPVPELKQLSVLIKASD